MRIIPAYAGNTITMATNPMTARDHPRLRGEHETAPQNAMVATGSSPLTRGTLSLVFGIGDDGGIIPAYAGNTPFHRHRRTFSEDHPRLRGEHASSSGSSTMDRGSSPLTRGTRYDNASMILRGGIIPAYARNTRGHPSRRRGSRDHPRLRGEHELSEIEPSSKRGSSPLTRGTPYDLYVGC